MSYPHVEKALQYAEDVVSGRILACKWVRLACQRHLRDLERQEDDAWPYWYDPRAAERVCKLIELLPHTKGKWAARHRGKSNLIVLEPWQCFIVCVLYGWMKKEPNDDGRYLRRFQLAYMAVPRKNGKSQLVAALGLYHLAADGEPGAEVYCGATSKDQAHEVFRPAKRMAESEVTEGFRRSLGVEVAAESIFVPRTGSFFRALIGKPGDGSSPSCYICDEFHEHKDSEQYDTMRTGQGAREQPITLVITTAGENIGSPCHLLQQDIEKILEGTITDAAAEETFGIIWTIDHEPYPRTFATPVEALRRLIRECTCHLAGTELDASPITVEDLVEDCAQHNPDCPVSAENARPEAVERGCRVIMPPDDWSSDEALAKANPNYGVSVFESQLKSLRDEALRSPRKQNIFKTKRLNVWVHARDPWMNMEAWHRQADAPPIGEFAGASCVAGMDLSSKLDLSAVSFIFRREIDGEIHYYAYSRSYLPEDRSREPGLEHYHGWVIEGHLIATEGSTIDYGRIKADILEDARRYEIQELCFDPWNTTATAQELAKEGITVVEIPQTTKNLSAPMKEIEALVLDGRFHHDGNPVLTWCVSNVTAKEDANENLFPRKESKEAKIDAAAAMITAMSRALVLPLVKPKSVYEERGVQVF